jgi:hypothetical protein
VRFTDDDGFEAIEKKNRKQNRKCIDKLNEHTQAAVIGNFLFPFFREKKCGCYFHILAAVQRDLNQLLIFAT